MRQFMCPHCGKQVVAAANPGEETRCTACNAILTVPDTASETNVATLLSDYRSATVSAQRENVPPCLGTYTVAVLLTGAGLILVLLALGLLITTNLGGALTLGLGGLTVLGLGLLLQRVRDIARHTWRANID